MSAKSLFASFSVLALAFMASGCCGLRTCNTGMFPLANLGGRLACGGGCGEVYVGEYINHPPVVDPCGGCGSCSSCDSCNGGTGYGYIGPSCQPARPIFERISALWAFPMFQPTAAIADKHPANPVAVDAVVVFAAKVPFRCMESHLVMVLHRVAATAVTPTMHRA